jgi:hypothetical protein
VFEPRTAHKRKALEAAPFLWSAYLHLVAHARVWNAVWNAQRSASPRHPPLKRAGARTRRVPHARRRLPPCDPVADS